MWRYRAAFPLLIPDPITLGEGMTPLVLKTLHGAKVLFRRSVTCACVKFVGERLMCNQRR